MRVGGPTKSHAPAPPLHPRRHAADRPGATRAFRASAPRAASPTASPTRTSCNGQARIRVAPKSARPTEQSACKIRSPRRRTTTHARAVPSPSVKSDASEIMTVPLFLCDLCALLSASSVYKSFPSFSFPKLQLSTVDCRLPSPPGLLPQQSHYLPAKLYDTLQRTRRHSQNLL